ncbi:hypothetical protein BDR03DRAFT_986169 [Suillus americanus]|nr:hypothetical protein BDR03DRAFT_986169 [Suillus americanus]
MSSLFDAAAALSPKAESMQHAFADLCEKMAAEAKCVPEDCPNLATEKEEWCRRWNKIMADIRFYIAAAKDKGIVLALMADEAIQGCKTAATHDKFVEQLYTLKEVAALQGQTQPAEALDAEMGEEVAGDNSGEEEIDLPEKSLRRIQRMAWSSMTCGANTRVLRQRFLHLLRSFPADPLLVQSVRSGRGSEGPILISDGKSVRLNSQALKVKPVVVLPSSKRKLAKVEEEDFALADSGLGGDDLAMAGKLRGVHAKVCTIQGLLADVFNNLDMMRAHLNKKAHN